MNIEQIIENRRIACPECKGMEFTINGEGNDKQLLCQSCGLEFDVLVDTPLMVTKASSLHLSKIDIQKFWGELYNVAYGEHSDKYNEHNYVKHFDELLELFEYRQHLAVNEMQINELTGKRVLEIGSGAGSHSTLFLIFGACMTSLDIT